MCFHVINYTVFQTKREEATKKNLDRTENLWYHAEALRSEYGGIAQLGERLNGIQEVSGSIPLISTKLKNALPLLSAEVLFYLSGRIYLRVPYFCGTILAAFESGF